MSARPGTAFTRPDARQSRHRQESPASRMSKAQSGLGRSDETQVPPGRAKKPGWFAPRGEKALYEAVQTQDPHAIHAVGEEHAEYRLLSDTLAGLMLIEDESTSESLYNGRLTTVATRRRRIRTEVPLRGAQPEHRARRVRDPADRRDAVGLTLAELRQERGDLDGAIDVVKNWKPRPTPPSRSLTCTQPQDTLTMSSTSPTASKTRTTPAPCSSRFEAWRSASKACMTPPTRCSKKR